ncbi:MAG: hypothetical protein ABI658_31980 [Acidimicrobiales bacterium]
MYDADIRALRQEIDRLQRRVDELSDQAPARIDAVPAADPAEMPRRGMLRTVGAAAAGVAVGSLAFAKPAGAIDGNSIVIGSTNTADSSTLLVTNSGYSASPLVGAFHVTDSAGSTDLNMSLSCISAIASGARQSIAFVGAGANVGAKFDGPVPLKLTDSTGSAAPTSSSGTVGQFKVTNGDLWFCAKSETGSSNDAVWRRLTGVAVAGGFVAIDPARAYDSRLAAYTTSGVLAPNTNRVVSVKDAHNGAGLVTTADIVPAGATAVTYNLTVTGTTEANFIAVTPGGATSFTASTINWTGPGASVANGGVCKLDASRQLKIFMGDQPGSAHIILDITGYYL